jgi:hypothetical protein
LPEAFECTLEFLHGFRFRFNAASIEVGNYFQTKIAGTPDAVCSQNGKQFGVLSFSELALSELLKYLRCCADVIHRFAIFSHQLKIDVLASQRLFEILQFDNRLI